MSGYIKYFDNGGKNMSFKIEDQIKDILNVTFHSQPIHDDKYMKTKAKTFNSKINTFFRR